MSGVETQVVSREDAKARSVGWTPGADVVPLSEARNVREVGGKACALARVISCGVAVPRGVVLTRVVFDQWLDDTGLRGDIAQLIGSVPPDDANAQCELSVAIRARILSLQLPAHAAGVIEAVGSQMLAEAPLVVRSSAVGEDGASASFAGQLDSILHVGTAADLRRAVQCCWASYWSERVRFYQRTRKVDLAGMAVIVQRQVPARESGVLFTRHPGGEPDSLLVESCPGLADGLVSGRIDPQRRTIPRSQAEREDLGRTALQLEKAFGTPQDIEWSRDKSGKLWIVQSRPITTPATPTPNHVWSNANVCENFPTPISPLLYSVASIGYYHYFRNLALAFGLPRSRIDAMEEPLRGIIGIHGARMYYNLTNIHAVLQLAPLGDRLTASFNEFVGAWEGSPAACLPRRSLTKAGGAPVLARIALCTARQFLVLRRRVETFERTADAFAARTLPEELSKRTLPELAADLAGFIDIRCNRWKDASLADAGAMISYSLLKRLLEAASAPPGLHNRLLRALPGVPSSRPPLRLWDLSRQIRADPALSALFCPEVSSRSEGRQGLRPEALRALRYEHPTPAEILDRIIREPAFGSFRREFQRYLDDWGFRSSAELMLTVPSPQENPLPLIELLRQYARCEGQPPALAIAQQAREREADTRRLLRGLLLRAPHKALAIALVLRAIQSAIGYRERARLKQAMLYVRCRRIALEIGRRLVAAGRMRAVEDIFMLTWQEIGSHAATSDSLAALVAARHKEHAAAAALSPPDRMVLPRGVVYSSEDSVAKPANLSAIALATAEGFVPRPVSTPTQTLRGTGACGGRVSARAAVLADVAEAGKLQRGDILVTRQTDPGWGPVFCLVSGLVIERGGMLSHGAIIAREFGLPCVVGIPDASRIIQHGDPLTVDGDKGECSIESCRGRPCGGPLDVAAGRHSEPNGSCKPDPYISLRTYLRERLNPALFIPVILLIATAGCWASGTLVLSSIPGSVVLATLMVVQFRLWDDLADRERDRLTHPDRVLVRADPAHFRVLALLLGLTSLVVAWRMGGPLVLAALASLNATFALLYGILRPHLGETLWGYPILLAKYPAFVATVAWASGEPSPLRTAIAAGAFYSAALIYEKCHDH